MHNISVANPAIAPQNLDVMTMLGFVILIGVVVNEPSIASAELRQEAVDLFDLQLASHVVQARCILCHVAGGLARLLQRPFVRNGTMRRLPPPLSAWTRYRTLPAVASKPFRKRWRSDDRG
ncbi:MAG: DUF3390 domain-containing protein [Candidatus Hydrogenedentes bacterium]|nr:DUF3390 domain-containing protein [Candidatus Hydrogenedentota bacterium]